MFTRHCCRKKGYASLLAGAWPAWRQKKTNCNLVKTFIVIL
jgi:hypothetical protein